MKNEKFYVTTPIYYANSQPHVGTSYTTLAADIIARYYRIKLGKDNVLFQVGTDEHGQKIAETADGQNKKPKEFLDELVPSFKKAWKTLNISFDVFIRTTDPRHVKVASELLQKIYDNGYIYKGNYEGFYCVGCEKYITKKELVDDKCPLHPNKKILYQREKNYFFKLSEFAPKVLHLIESGKVNISPEHRKKEIINRIKDGVNDLSISRESVDWGIPIPWEVERRSTLWVWVEALINYYSVTRFSADKNRFWPADLHLVGKDILWFHTCIWLSLLLAADLELPKQIFGHGFFTIDGQKISKSLGNTITPGEFVDRYGVDGSRYLIISSTPFGEDRDIKREDFDKKYTSDLVNGLGNLVARVATMAEREGAVILSRPTSEQVPNGLSSDERHLRHPRGETPLMTAEVAEAIERFEFDKALRLVWNRIRKADKLINKKEVWKLKGEKKKRVLAKLVDMIRQIGVDLQPFLPETAEKIKKQFARAKIVRGKNLFERL